MSGLHQSITLRGTLDKSIRQENAINFLLKCQEIDLKVSTFSKKKAVPKVAPFGLYGPQICTINGPPALNSLENEGIC